MNCPLCDTPPKSAYALVNHTKTWYCDACSYNYGPIYTDPRGYRNERYDYALHEVANYWDLNPDQRLGQATFNQISMLYPEFTKTIHGTSEDPFYNDRKLGGFLELFKEWCGDQPNYRT